MLHRLAVYFLIPAISAFVWSPGALAEATDHREFDEWCQSAADCLTPLMPDRPRSHFVYAEGEDPLFFWRDNYLPRGYFYKPANDPLPDLAIQVQNPAYDGTSDDWDVRYFQVNVGGCQPHHRFPELSKCSFWMEYTLEPVPDLYNAIGRVSDLDPQRCNRFRLYRGIWGVDGDGAAHFTPQQMEAETVIQLHPEFIVVKVVVHRFYYTPSSGGAGVWINGLIRSSKELKNLFDKTDDQQNNLDQIRQTYENERSQPGFLEWSWNPLIAAQPMDSLYRGCGIGFRLVEVREHNISDPDMVYNVNGKNDVGGCGTVWNLYSSSGFEAGVQSYHIYLIESFDFLSSTSVGQTCMSSLRMALKNHSMVETGNVFAHELGHAVGNWADLSGYNDFLMDQGAGTIIPPGRCCYARSNNWSELFDSTNNPQLSNVERMSYEDGDVCTALAGQVERPWTDLHPPSTPHPDNVDQDGDGVPDRCDNCAVDANPNQEICPNLAFGGELGMACDADSDNDCIDTADDNCPDNANHAQADCNGNGVGDACDPELCAYLPHTGFERICGYDSGIRWCRDTGEHKIYYRLSGYDANSTQRTAPLLPRYCACQDENGNSYDAQYCRDFICPTQGIDNGDTDADTGWLSLNWRGRQEQSPGDAIECTVTDADGNGVVNECVDAIPDRVYHRLYHDENGPTGQGAGEFDYQAFWGYTVRTRHYYWRWEDEEWPHASGTQWSWTSGSNHTASGMVWLHPGVDTQELPLTEGNAYSEPIFFTGDRFYPDPYLSNSQIEIGQFIRTGNLGQEMEAPVVLLHGLAWSRSPDELGSYQYEQSRPSAALLGMQMLTLDAVSGYLDGAQPSQAAAGSVPLDVTDTAFCTVAVPQMFRSTNKDVYAFGGRDRAGALEGILWRGTVNPEQLSWEEVDLGGAQPAPRQGSALFWSAPLQRLVLLGGQEATDATPITYLIEPASAVGATAEATTLQGDILGRRAFFAYTQSGDLGLIYGGRDPQAQTLDGLYAIRLETLRVSHLDWPSDTGPGPRIGAALELSMMRKTVLLFGGQDAEGVLHNDLWSFEPRRAQWTQLREDCFEDNCPPGMKHASIVMSPMDGTLRVATGVQQRSPNEDLIWSLDQTGRWQSDREATGECEGAACWQALTEPEQESAKGCGGCAQGSQPVGLWLMLPLLWLFIRRRVWPST